MKTNQKKFKIRYQATFISDQDDNGVKIWVAMPIDSDLQKIHSIDITPSPYSIYRDEQGIKIGYFVFKNDKNIVIKMDISVSLWQAYYDSLIFSLGKFERYIKSEKFLEQLPIIKKLTSSLTQNKKEQLEKIKSIFSFIIDEFKYCYPVKNRGVKNLNLKNLKGDCGEYSSLFVTMCRIVKIPARNLTGFVVFPKQKKMAEHGWASIYSKNLGWLDVDCQYASLGKNKKDGLRKYLCQRNDYRLVFTNGFNISLKPAIPRDFNIDYLNEIGLPMSRTSAQTLQPLVFASKGKIKFNDSISLI